MRIIDWSSYVCSSDLQEAAHRRGLADADGADARANILHRVVDRHARRYDPARRVDVHIDVLLRIFRLEEQQLGDDQRRHLVLDLAGYEDAPFAQPAGEDVEAAFAAARLFVDHGKQERKSTHLNSTP